MFGWEFPPYNSGGLGTACEGLTRALSELAVPVTFVLPKNVAARAPFMRKFVYAGVENLKVRELPGLLYPYVTDDSYRQLLNSVPGGLYGESLLEEVKLYAERARKIAETEEFDVIHAHDWLAFPAGLVAKAASGKKLIVHVHATEFDRTGGAGVNAAVYQIEREGMQRADQIVAVSDWTKQLIVKHYGVDPDKVCVVHNGIELDGYTAEGPGALEALKQNGNKIVLFVGRITLQKGPDYFVQMAKKILEHNQKVFFVMVGTGDMLPQVIQQAAYMGIADHFIFPGFLRGEELNRVYRSADIYILPSVSEPFGITPLEALANGTPVLVSKQSGVSEVLSHALKVDFWDVNEMTNQVLALLEHSSLHQTLAQNSRHDIARTSWLEAAKKILALYH